MDDKLTMSQQCTVTDSNVMGCVRKSVASKPREKNEEGFDSSFITKHCCHWWKLDLHLVGVSDISCQLIGPVKRCTKGL